MDKSVRTMFSPALLEQALKNYDIKPEDAKALDGFESFIYEVQKGDQEYILRVGHDRRRPADMVHAEASFLNYLAAGGLSVPKVLPAADGQLTTSLAAPDGSHFVTTLFTKAPGHPPTREFWQPALFVDMGRFLGKLHRLSKDYHPNENTPVRYAFADDAKMMLIEADKFLPKEDHSIYQIYRETINAILSLPKDAASYGLCHNDFHSGNFFLTDDGRITLFDFDDCHYNWYVNDIAMALFYAISMDCQSKKELAEARSFFDPFWEGYQRENTLDPAWLEKIPLFLQLREIDLYIIIHRSMDLNNLDPWCTRYMDRRREKILNGTPYCKLDYTAYN